MSRRVTLAFATTALCLAVAFPVGHAVAQEKQHVSYKAGAENSKYTQQISIDVGDVPGHIVRAFEIQRTFPNNAPVINGLKIAEHWSRGRSDLINGNGSAVIYGVYIMENGDRIFSRTTLVAQNLGGDKFTTTTAGPITGGTGKFAGITGILRTTGTSNPKVGFTESQFELEFSVTK
jgi:hypothetical protein